MFCLQFSIEIYFLPWKKKGRAAYFLLFSLDKKKLEMKSNVIESLLSLSELRIDV